MATFTLHARRAAEAARNARLLAQLALEEDAPRFERPGPAAVPVDERTLRGIPAVGRGVAGAVPGSSPEREVVLRDERRRRGGSR